MKDSPIFAGVGFAEVQRLTQNLKEIEFKKGAEIIKQGVKGLHAYLLLEGKVEVYYRSKEGERTTIIFHSAPFIFGEVELWKEHPYMANVRALESCTVLEISKKDYMRILQSNHQVCINLVKLLSELLVQTGNDRRVKFFGRVENLLAYTLCYHANMYGEERRNGTLIKKAINKKELADTVGVARQSIIRALKNLEKDGFVKISGTEILIPDLELLQRKALDL